MKKNPLLAESIIETLIQLSLNPYENKLKTHKLKGKFEGTMACRAGFDLRIIFRIVNIMDEKTKKPVEAILLDTIGTHDEVY